ncbi:transporter substrate-binding domain-containing protein [Pseudomonas sp. CCM 7891]|uniref:histidine kinase n=1 Tax=Pseudomonas karstica TaxID=1055468 RepID=A0A7X2RS40_9PSED|nr:transporter substrate-binding domain-containing protein [Pseudomonas karstica]MTD18907.1 transporter substrate-binding domain-containing protein [Pseudomonas karstica]
MVLLAALCTVGPALAEPTTLKLLGRSSVEDYKVNLDEADWRWLREKDRLQLGISSPDYAPFNITIQGRYGLELEGLTADYAALVGQLLHLDIVVLCYDSRTELLQALKNGQVDLVGTANGFEAADPELAMTQAYAQDQPVLADRNLGPNALMPGLAAKRIAMLYHYRPPEQVRRFYPKAHLQLYPSTLSALGAVAFGQADVYLGDSISANYLINKNYLNNVKMVDFSEMELNSFGFAVAAGDQPLLRIVNRALAAIPENERVAILRRWSAGGVSMVGTQSLHFSKAEQHWIKAHPQIKVVINEGYLPLSFFDGEGRFSGISADVLARVSLRTGLTFDVQQAESVEEMVQRVATGKADMVAAITSSMEREEQLRFARPYLTNPFVLISRNTRSSPDTLDDMTGKRLALIQGNRLTDYITDYFPHVQLVPAQDAAHAMALVAHGDVDAAVNSLISARYMISREYRDRLHITSTVGTEPAGISFGVGRGALELYSILDKALLSISPEEMDELTNRWRSDVVVEDSYWRRYRATIIQGFALAGLLLVVTLGWAIYLRSLIRKRAQAERALSDQMRFMSVLIDGTPHPIYVRDRLGRLMACNSAYLDVFGFKLEDVIGKSVVETNTGNLPQAQAYHDDYLRLMEIGEPQICDRVLKAPGGVTLTIYHWMLPYRDGDENVVGMIAGWVDVSERQQLLGQLQEAKEGADAANRAKTTFLATMSHEIRTPMNAVIGMIELALKNAEQGRVDRDALEVASDASRGMLELIGDILDIARIESGHLSLTLEPSSLRQLLESVSRIFEGLARAKGLLLRVDLDTRIDRHVLIDPMRFKQVVSNLLSNAIKFTDTGQVRLRADVTPAANNGYLNLSLSVEDTGIGICSEDQSRLFSPFIQGRNTEQSARSGSGLGLVISRSLCQMMGGQLQLSSVLGQGTRVDVRLSLAIAASAPASVAQVALGTPVAHALSILIVDDYPANRLLLARQLNFLGHRITTAEDGAEGFERWQAGPFDVVITDCNMPLKDGYELAREIRCQERERNMAQCLLLGFTANAQPEETERCLRAGMDGCLFKPTGLEDLHAALAGRTASPSVAEPGIPANTPGFCLSTLMKLTGGNAEEIEELLAPLLDSLAADRVQLAALQSEAEFSKLHDLAHRTKGGACMVKAQALITCCEALEAVCERRSGDGLAAAVEGVGEAIDHLRCALSTYCKQD